MATSIDKSTNWRNAVKDVGYEGAANPNVVVAEQANTNNKAMKVAAALGQVGDSLGQLANTHNSITQQQQAQAARVATALERDEAKIQALREVAIFNETQKKVNYDEKSTWEGSFDNFTSSEEGESYNTIYESLAHNPQAQAVFTNTFRLQTEAPLIKAVGDSVLKRQKDSVANQLPTALKELQGKFPNDPTKVFVELEKALFGKLTGTDEDSYGLKNEIAAEMLGDIFNTYALSRDENGRANTSLAEQYILSGKGGDAMREKLATTIIRQNAAAASERGVKRTEDKIAEEKSTKEYEVMLRAGEWVTTDAHIFANSDLTDNQKTYLVDINQRVNKQKAIAAEPTLKADAKKLFLKTKRDIMKAAVKEDFTAFGFAEGVVPTAEEFETRLSELYLGKMANENDFNQLVESAQKSLSINEFIDSAESSKPLKVQFNQLKDQFKANSFGRYMKNYSKAVLDGTPVLTHLTSELQREVHELVEEHVEAGNNLTNKTLSGFYEQAAQKVMEPIIEYVNSDNRKEFLDDAGGTEEPTGEVSEDPEAPSGGLEIGTIDNGYTYVGGDPNSQESWVLAEEVTEDTSENKKYQLSLTDALVPEGVQDAVSNVIENTSQGFLESQVRNMLFNRTTYEQASEERVQEALAEIEKIGIEAWRAKN